MFMITLNSLYLTTQHSSLTKHNLPSGKHKCYAQYKIVLFHCLRMSDKTDIII